MTDDGKLFGIDADEMFASLGLAGLSDEQKEKHLKKFKELLEGRIILRLIDVVSEEDQKAMENMGRNDMIEYLSDKEIDLYNIALEEANAFRAELAGNLGYMQGLIDSMKTDDYPSEGGQA